MMVTVIPIAMISSNSEKPDWWFKRRVCIGLSFGIELLVDCVASGRECGALRDEHNRCAHPVCAGCLRRNGDGDSFQLFGAAAGVGVIGDGTLDCVVSFTVANC